jgi:hypothetical protein
VSRAFVIGLVLAVTCLAYVLYPLVGRGRWRADADWERGRARAVTDDEIEAAIRSYRAALDAGRVCSVCGPRPESDAVFCSTCGRPLDRGAASP